MSDEPMIRMADVSFAYEGGAELFSGLSAELPRGSLTLVRGPSGSGKSTLLRILCRLEAPVSGALYLDGEPYAEWPAPQLRRRVVYLRQTPTVVPGDVRGNLLLPFSFKANQDLEAPGDDDLAGRLDDMMLGDVGLSRDARTLSVGQKQRLCLLRALLPGPRALLLDEPASALDAESRRVVEAAAEDFCLRGGTVVMISHAEYEPSRVEPRALDVRSGKARAA
jgi:putative ABC transport system ATP-binding protein